MAGQAQGMCVDCLARERASLLGGTNALGGRPTTAAADDPAHWRHRLRYNDMFQKSSQETFRCYERLLDQVAGARRNGSGKKGTPSERRSPKEIGKETEKEAGRGW